MNNYSMKVNGKILMNSWKYRFQKLHQLTTNFVQSHVKQLVKERRLLKIVTVNTMGNTCRHRSDCIGYFLASHLCEQRHGVWDKTDLELQQTDMQAYKRQTKTQTDTKTFFNLSITRVLFKQWRKKIQHNSTFVLKMTQILLQMYINNETFLTATVLIQS